jgi:hypothetical protein
MNTLYTARIGVIPFMIFVCIASACICGAPHITFDISIDLIEFNFVHWELCSDFNNVKLIRAATLISKIHNKLVSSFSFEVMTFQAW